MTPPPAAEPSATSPASLDAFRRYLRPRTESFWRWSPSGDALVWDDGVTIMLTAELVGVLEAIRLTGVPQLDAIAYLAAACRESWSDPPERPAAIARRLELSGPGTGDLFDAKLRPQLDRVHQLPAEFRQGAGLALVAQVAFETYPDSYFRQSGADALVETLRTAHLPSLLENATPSSGGIRSTLHRLSHALEAVTEETLRLRQRTGLHELPQPIENDSDDGPPSLRDLLAELVDDPELGGLARVARNLAASVHLPRALGDPDDQPLGGISDIGNRGDFDRLLISELAADDDVLMTRVALDEALYYRREKPPSAPPRRRVVLLDTGLRTWGTPRLLIVAAATAMLAADEDATELFRPFSVGAKPIDLTTREGLVDQLESLGTHDHPGRFLKGWRSHLEPDDDAVLLTTDDTLADERFEAALLESGLLPLYLGVVSRDGRFTLLTRTELGTRTIRTVDLDLTTLLRPVATAATKPGEAEPLPAVLHQFPSPLSLPTKADPETIVPGAGDRLYGVAAGGQWIAWDEGDDAARVLSDKLPAKLERVMLLEPIADLDAAQPGVIVLQPDKGYPLLLRYEWLAADAPPTKKLIGGGGRPIGACRVGPEHIALVRSGSVDLYAIADASHDQSLLVPGEMVWQGDRFFRGPEGWYTLSRTRRGGQFDLLIDNRIIPAGSVVRVVQPFGRSPLAVLDNGDVYHCDSGESVRLNVRGVHVLEARYDPVAAAIVMKTQTASGAIEHRGYFDSIRQFLDEDLLATATGRGVPTARWTLRHRFDAIGQDRANGSIALRSRRGSWSTIDLLSVGPDVPERLIFRNRDEPPPEWAAFEPVPPVAAPKGVGYRLATAEWRGGRAWLDSRGLLHLRQADADAPEATLYLDTVSIGLQCSDGRVAGSHDYFGGVPDARPVELATLFREVLIRFASRI